MTCTTCTNTGKPRVTLVDGRQCCTWCDDWRHECEARAVLAMTPLARRRAYLYGTIDRWGKMSGGINKRRGPEALKRLEDTMTLLYRKRVADAKQRLAEREPGTPLRPANDNAALPLTSAQQA